MIMGFRDVNSSLSDKIRILEDKVEYYKRMEEDMRANDMHITDSEYFYSMVDFLDGIKYSLSILKGENNDD